MQSELYSLCFTESSFSALVLIRDEFLNATVLINPARVIFSKIINAGFSSRFRNRFLALKPAGNSRLDRLPGETEFLGEKLPWRRRTVVIDTDD